LNAKIANYQQRNGSFYAVHFTEVFLVIAELIAHFFNCHNNCHIEDRRLEE
jgi:hypothetical protein